MEQQNARLRPPKYLESVQSPSPTSPLQSFSQTGFAPFGYVIGEEPEGVVASPSTLRGEQPVYHLKVTTTPVHVPGGPGKSDYVVAASPAEDESINLQSTQFGEVTAHAAPDLSGAERRGLTIRPLTYIYPHAQPRPMAPEIAPSEVPVTRPSEHAALIQPQPGEVRQQMPDMGVQPEGARLTDAPGRHALVHLYGGPDIAETRALLQRTYPQGAPGTDQVFLERGPSLESHGSGAPPSAAPLERGFTRAMSRPLEISELEGEEREKIYNWIVPADGAPGPIPIPEEPKKEKLVDKLFRPWMKESQEDKAKKIGDMFARLSFQDRLPEAEEIERAKEVYSAPGDEDLGLPAALRPSIHYGGAELAPPQYAGEKAPLKYKLHAIEVHQYIPLPSQEEPWFVRNSIDPITTALFGPMPNPFDLGHTGMVAASFQRTIAGQPAPVLSPEMSHMFNHELDVISRPGQDPQESMVC